MLFATTIFAVFLHVAIGEKSSLSRTHEYSETKIYTDNSPRSNIPLVYARCNSSQPIVEKQCVVTMKIDAFEKSAVKTKECTVNLKSVLKYGVINDQICVYAFGRDKVLFVWTETQSASDSEDEIEHSILKATVVHMFDECRTFDENIREDLWHPYMYLDDAKINVIIFNNTFEMRLAKLNEDCQAEWCYKVDEYRLYKFDDRARAIGEIEHWPGTFLGGYYQYSTIQAMMIDRPEKGYFVTNYNSSTILVELINKTATGYHQHKVWEKSSNTSYPITRWSLANEAIGFCHVDTNRSLGCWQSDQQGNIHTQVNVTLETPHKAHLSAVHNLQNGRFLLAVPKCSKSDCYKSGRSRCYENYYLMQVDGKSNVNSVEVQFGNKCHSDDNSVFIKLFENKRGQYCIVRLCQSSKLRKLVKNRLVTSVQCYSSDDFSKCTNCV